MTDPDPTFFPTPEDFRAWLEANHATVDHLWVGYYKKATGKPSVTWEQTVDEALCYGWIDGIRKSRDEESYVIRFTPRRPKSVWSQRNIDLVEKLKAEGRMKPEGLAAYAHKKAHPDSGYRTKTMDAEFSEEILSRFKAAKKAWAFFEAQPPGYRKKMRRWIMSAKKEETRERRLKAIIELSEQGLRAGQSPPKT